MRVAVHRKRYERDQHRFSTDRAERRATQPNRRKLIEMTNGCICCTLRDDLLQEVSRLAREGRFDYLLIESTGISEPLPVAAIFTFVDETGQSLSEVARLDKMVTLIDAAKLLVACGCLAYFGKTFRSVLRKTSVAQKVSRSSCGELADSFLCRRLLDLLRT